LVLGRFKIKFKNKLFKGKKTPQMNREKIIISDIIFAEDVFNLLKIEI